MWNLSRHQVNDSDPLETLADRRGTETLPLTQFQPMPRRHRRIQRRDTTGNYVTNKGEWQRLGRGGKQRYITNTKDNKRRRLLQKDERQMGSTTLNIRNEGSFMETSPVRQEH